MSISKSAALLLVLVFLIAPCLIVAEPALSSADVVEDSWVSKAPMQQARGGLGVAVANGKIYAIGGSTLEGSPPYTDGIVGTNEEYDPATDTWETKAPIPTFRYGLEANLVNGKIYLIGGDDNGSSLVAPSFNEVYDPENDSWTVGADIPTDRSNFGVAIVSDLIYVIGGATAYPTGINFINQPSTITKYATNERYTPIGYGTIPPTVRVVSPENKTYNVTSVSLVFTVNKPAVWMGYSLDGQDNVTISGNTTLAGLTSGLHNVTVYAKDAFENMGASETITFTIAKETEPFPIRLAAAATIVVAAVVLVAAVCVGLSAYLKKRK